VFQFQNAIKSALSHERISLLQRAYYKAVPCRIRSLIQGGNRDEIFQNAMTEFIKDPGACAYPGNPVLKDLIYGWGNEAWSALDEFLAGCIEHAMLTEGPVLECGTGLSTVLLGVVAKKQNLNHYALEHKPEWAPKVQTRLNSYHLDTVIHAKPLKDYGDYCWYDLTFDEMPESVALVVCDGPPRRTKGGRFGLIPVMKDRLKSGCVILLDDAERKEELDIAKRWQTELETTFNVHGKLKPYIKMVIA
jgi:hypothetical protein